MYKAYCNCERELDSELHGTRTTTRSIERTDASSREQQDIRSTVPCTGDKENRKIRVLGGYFSSIEIAIIHSVWHVRVRSFYLFIPFAPPNDDKQLHSTSFSKLNHIDHGGLVLVDGVPQSALCVDVCGSCGVIEESSPLRGRVRPHR